MNKKSVAQIAWEAWQDKTGLERQTARQAVLSGVASVDAGMSEAEIAAVERLRMREIR